MLFVILTVLINQDKSQNGRGMIFLNYLFNVEVEK
jgi:hypothetical protein